MGSGKSAHCNGDQLCDFALLTHFRYTTAPSPSIVDEMKAVTNSVETEEMRRAYLRDGASYVR